MRTFFFVLLCLTAVLTGACDLLPNQLKPFEETLEQQLSGDATVWLLGGDVVIIDVSGSPSYRMQETELGGLATEIAEQAMEYAERPLESIVVTFYEDRETDGSDKEREFIFLVMKNRPVLQPHLPRNATGPLTNEEIQAAIVRMDQSYDQMEKSLTDGHRECVLATLERRAAGAGDPEHLDPATVEFLTSDTWYLLDGSAKRIFLAQALLSEALFSCADSRVPEAK
ncbi:MAG: hypothetical protein WBM97_09720 [Sedimenticolaceae bacterium]